MSKNQLGPLVGPGGRSDFRYLSVTQNSKRSLFAFALPAVAPLSDRSDESDLSDLSDFLPGVGVTGLEPVTLRLSSACSNQLSYTPVGWLRIRLLEDELPFACTVSAAPLLSSYLSTPCKVEAWGFEPQTYSLQSYRSTN